MDWIEAVIIAIVEGITEFMPISSTGHMIITESILGIKPDAYIKAFTVIIQFGAILSVLVLYWRRFFQSFDFYWKLFIAFIPAAVLGLLFSDKIDELLESVQVVAIMLILGGLLMLIVDTLFEKTSKDQTITPRKALIIGLCQCIAMVPGVSRSMATIVGGMSQQLTRKHAAEFSFFLAVPTMFAASAYKVFKLMMNPESKKLLINNLDTLIIGNVVAFIVAVFAIKFFIDFIRKYGFKAFGYYRIIVGGLILGMMLLGHNLQIG